MRLLHMTLWTVSYTHLYVVAKIPRFPFDKFEKGERRLGTQMKATGEVMAIGRNIEESILKACRSLEIGVHYNEMPELANVSDDALTEKVVKAQDDRLFYVSEAIRRGYTPEEIADLTKIDIFYLDKLLHIFEICLLYTSAMDVFWSSCSIYFLGNWLL